VSDSSTDADVVLTGAQIIDPDSGRSFVGEVALRDDKIATVRAGLGTLSAATVVHLDGLLLTPGLVDLHTHVFAGQDLGVDADAVCGPAGVTTVVDAGSAGAHLLGAFRRSAVSGAATRIRAMLNVSSIGTTSILLAGELSVPAYVDEVACIACARENADLVVGIKVRASANVGPGQVVAALGKARRIADVVGLPLMVHVGPGPPSLTDVLNLLGPGDVLTHCFTGLAHRPIAGAAGVLGAALRARERGVVFDVGHGNAGFDVRVATAAIRAGFFPDTISTDVHAYSRAVIGDLPLVMTKFLALGMSLPQVVAAASAVPARTLGLVEQGIGTLREGAPADIAVLEMRREAVVLTDCRGHRFSSVRRLRTVMTVRSGKVVYDARMR
jgi:dihydroorotase